MTADERVRAQAAMYSAEAEAYARVWAPILHPLGRSLLRRLPLAGARRILDIGTGTGVLHADLRAAAPGALVVGVDRAEGMLRAARGSPRIPVAVMDAVRLGIPDECFDAALMSFVLHHMPEPVVALAEARRVLAPGGVLAVTTWGEYEDCPALEEWTAALDEAGAVADKEVAIANHELMDTKRKLAGLLTAAGCRVARTATERFEHRWGRDEFLDYVRNVGRRKRRLDALPAAARRAFERGMGERLAQLSPDEFAYRADVVFGVGMR